jgi:D-threo-aldose 1-dehydrogenase
MIRTMPPTGPRTVRPLGRTSLEVTAICVGTAPLGDMGDVFGFVVPEERALATLREVFASPITFLDTAAIYGNGTAERRIGDALRAIGGLPPGWLVATKADRDPATGDFSGAQMQRSIEGSLSRLGLDRLPLVYIHDPEHTTFERVMARGGPLDVLQGLQREGVIGHLGISGGPIDMLIRYVETDAFAAVETHGMLAKGPDAFARYAYQDAPTPLIERTRRLDAVCREHDVPLAAAALQFSMRDSRVTSTVVGMTRPERVAQTLALAAMPIPETLWSALDTIGFDMDDPEAARWKD